MAFLSLYRKYRPNNFDDLVGQQHVVQTLKNALKNDRIAHAYLFAGPRGTGKTSTAKVFAQILNCKEGTPLKPCGECESCRTIQAGQSIDVIEIDAASNRGIDEIRELREKVKFYPSEGDYKVYIIDEVHMLTTGAFNALLKTLEEPPANVVFILATTEPHKIISTIMSRCQRFDFSLLSVNDIQKRLEYICQQEEIEYEDEALNIIAHSSNGGLRDAISILDQSISFTDSKLTADGLQQMLGKVDKKVLSQFAKYIVENDTASALKLVNELIETGISVSRFVDDLLDHVRQLLLIKECGVNSGLLEYPPERLELMEKESKALKSTVLARVVDILVEIEQELKYTNQSRLRLEVGIVKMTSPAADSSLGGLQARISELEFQLKELQKNGVSGNNITINTENKTETGRVVGNVPEKKDDQKSSFTNSGNIDNSAETRENEEASSTGLDQNLSTEANKNPEFGKQHSNDKIDKTDKSNSDNTSGTTVNENGDANLSIDEVRKAWPTILSRVKDEDIKTNAFLIEGKPVKVENQVVYIQFSENKNFHRKGAEKQKGLITKVFNMVLDGTCQLEFISSSSDNSKKKLDDSKKEDDEADDMINKIVELFDGEVIKVNCDYLEK